ncbi:MAG: arginine N-succinyltransferase, partial [Pseudomonadota bacterium]
MSATDSDLATPAQTTRRGFSGLQVLGIIFAVILVTAAVTYWFVRSYVYAREFKPVELSVREQTKLDSKLAAIGLEPESVMPNARRTEPTAADFDADGRLKPERYSEDGASRDIKLSERELNALVASNPELARRFAVDLSNNLASARIVVPVDPDFPVLGGKTLRVNAGLELKYGNARPIVILRGVSVMGVPIPNAWMGNLKNVDLVEQFGGDPGFWQAFADGVESINIRDGALQISLKE